MPLYRTTYRLKITSVNGDKVTVDISDTLSGPLTEGEEMTIHPLTGSGNPIELAFTDNDEDGRRAIRAQQLTVRVKTDSSLDATTFLKAQDRQYLVTAGLGADPGEQDLFFVGWLMVDDMEEEFESPPNILTLVATDGLGALKDMPLTDLNGAYPLGYFNVMQFIAWALLKTGLTLEIIASNNISLDTKLGQSYLRTTYLHSPTFEAEMGRGISCYEALEAILAPHSFIVQRGAAWFIQRKAELYLTSSAQLSKWDAEGYFLQELAPETRTYAIGKREEIYFLRGARVNPQRKHKRAETVYNFVAPEELLANMAFERGARATPVPTPPDTMTDSNGNVITLEGESYYLDYWTLGAMNPSTTPLNGGVYIRRYYKPGLPYEEDRYIAFTTFQNTGNYYVSSRRTLVEKGDSYEFGISWKTTVNQTGATGAREARSLAHIRLYGLDGKYYVYKGAFYNGGERGVWVESNAAFTSNVFYIGMDWELSSVDETDWLSHSETIEPLPAGGELAVFLMHNVKETTQETHFKELKFSYVDGVVNGSRSKYKGHRHSREAGGNYPATYAATLKVSDSPHAVFKGALLEYNPAGTILIKAGLFYDGLEVPDGAVPGPGALYSFSDLVNRDQWQEVRNEIRRFSGSVQINVPLPTVSLDNWRALPHPAQAFYITDLSHHSNNRLFMVTNLSLDLKTMQAEVSLVEIYNIIAGRDYSDPHTFRLIDERK